MIVRAVSIVLLLVPALTLEVVADELYFPPSGSDWERIAPADAGWNSTKLTAAIEFTGQQKSSGIVVLYRGRILAERYWELDAKPMLFQALIWW